MAQMVVLRIVDVSAFGALTGVPASSFLPVRASTRRNTLPTLGVASLINSLLIRRRGLIRHAPNGVIHQSVGHSRLARGVTDHASSCSLLPQISKTKGKLRNADLTL